MRLRRSIGALLILMSLLGLAAAGEQSDAARSEATVSPVAFVVQIGNRMYPTWSDTVRVELEDSFFLGDTEYQASIREFLPDFRIIDGKIGSVTQTLGNPAAHVYVFNDSATVDSSWAFLNHPPHFSPKSFFTFQLKEIIGFVPQKDTQEESKGEK